MKDKMHKDVTLIEFKAEIAEYIQVLKSKDSFLIQSRKLSLLKSLESIVDCQLQIDEVQDHLQEMQEAIAMMGQGDFSKRLGWKQSDSVYSIFATLINMLSEELRQNVVKKYFLVEVLEHVSDLVMITDRLGNIIFVSTKCEGYLNMKREDLLYFQIANIFETKKRFGVDNKLVGETKFEVNLLPHESNPFKVNVYVKELRDNGITDGYIYIIKRF
jgi:signal transduction histidine kinase